MEPESTPNSQPDLQPDSHGEDDSRLILDSIRRIVQLLRRSSNQSERRMGLSAAQLFVLHKLRDVERLSVGELAARTLTSQSSVSEVVQKLVTAGHVARARSPRDGRSVDLSLTAEGRKLIEQAPIAPQDYLLAGVSRMPPRERRQLARLISRLVKETGMVNIEPKMISFDSASLDDESPPSAAAAPAGSGSQLTTPRICRHDRQMLESVGPEPLTVEPLTVEQAIAILDAAEVFPRRVVVELDDSAGLVLGEDLCADRDYPPFRKSLMDGYAVRASDVADGGAELRVVGEIAAGAWPKGGIQPGEAMAIMTGAPLPVGADGVVPVEDVESRAKVGEILRVLRASDIGRFVAAAASDCPVGRVVLRRGMRLGPAQIAVAASIGASKLSCFARPRVAVLGTGDELVPVEQTPALGQIRDSNTPMLTALLRQLGCDVISVFTARDEPEALRAALRRGLEADALVVAGGMSMGAYDYVPALLAELGVEVKITKLRIKPGKPFVFGIGASPRAMVFGLPGNPVSAFVCTIRLAARVFARLAGAMPGERWLSARLAEPLPANGPREFHQPAMCSLNESPSRAAETLPTIAPLAWKGSADVFALATANALLVRPSNDPPLGKGAIVRYLEI